MHWMPLPKCTPARASSSQTTISCAKVPPPPPYSSGTPGKQHAGPPGRGPGLGIGAVLRPPARLVRRELGLDEAAHAAAEDAQLLVHPGRPVAHRAAPRRGGCCPKPDARRRPPRPKPDALCHSGAGPFICRRPRSSRGRSLQVSCQGRRRRPEGCCRRARAADWPGQRAAAAAGFTGRDDGNRTRSGLAGFRLDGGDRHGGGRHEPVGEGRSAMAEALRPRLHRSSSPRWRCSRS